MNDVLSKSGFLRTTRTFPEDLHQLCVEVNRSYVDIAHNVNSRVIGTFPTNRSIVTGENWYITQAKKQQGVRQVYQWSDTNLTIAHGLDFLSLTNFVRIWGTFFDGTNWQALPYVDVVNATNQINVKVNATSILITKGAGSPPACTKGLICLEYLGNP